MNVDDLVRMGKLRREPAAAKQAAASLQQARGSWRTAQATATVDHDWTATIAYTAILQAGRALAFSEGLRPARESGHWSVIQFLKIRLANEPAVPVSHLDALHGQRNRAVYDVAGTVTERQAAEALEIAAAVLAVVEDRLGAP